jgi:hypothetical protein
VFHEQSKFKSIGCINKEKEIIEKIIDEKKIKEEELDFFKNKIYFLDLQAEKLQNLVENGVLTIEQYKISIQQQLSYEKSMIDYLNKDFRKNQKNLNAVSEKALEITYERINERMKIIEEELSQEIPEDNDNENENNNDNEEKVQEEKNISGKENENTPNTVNEITSNISKENKIDELNKQEDVKKIVIDTILFNKIKARLCDYKNAYHYFIQNGMSLRAEEANKRSNNLFKQLKKVENGEEVNEFELPIDITPEFICGYNSEERQKKYYNLIKEVSNKKTTLNDTLHELINKFNGYSKKEVEKHVSSSY